jgi:hypothetical protein
VIDFLYVLLALLCLCIRPNIPPPSHHTASWWWHCRRILLRIFALPRCTSPTAVEAGMPLTWCFLLFYQSLQFADPIKKRPHGTYLQEATATIYAGEHQLTRNRFQSPSIVSRRPLKSPSFYPCNSPGVGMFHSRSFPVMRSHNAIWPTTAEIARPLSVISLEECLGCNETPQTRQGMAKRRQKCMNSFARPLRSAGGVARGARSPGLFQFRKSAEKGKAVKRVKSPSTDVYS